MFKLIEELRWLPALVWVAFGFAFAGFVDFFTGTEIRVFPLYFLALCFASWRFGKPGAVASTVAATGIWVVSNLNAGLQYSNSYIWVINALSQALAFGTVAAMFFWARRLLDHEKSISNTDGLTGLANARAFRSAVTLALATCRRQARPISLAFIDLDNFKLVNDRLGHARGDALLQDVARVLQESLRTTDHVARMGGDEFVVCLPETPAPEAGLLMERVKAALNTIFPGYEVGVSASIGVCCWSKPPDDVEQLISAADGIMYGVKSAGKNRVEVVSVDTAQAM